jgi:SHAQKYF class myb-like DNA-binding protein
VRTFSSLFLEGTMPASTPALRQRLLARVAELEQQLARHEALVAALRAGADPIRALDALDRGEDPATAIPASAAADSVATSDGEVAAATPQTTRVQRRPRAVRELAGSRVATRASASAARRKEAGGLNEDEADAQAGSDDTAEQVADKAAHDSQGRPGATESCGDDCMSNTSVVTRGPMKDADKPRIEHSGLVEDALNSPANAEHDVSGESCAKDEEMPSDEAENIIFDTSLRTPQTPYQEQGPDMDGSDQDEAKTIDPDCSAADLDVLMPSSSGDHNALTGGHICPDNGVVEPPEVDGKVTAKTNAPAEDAHHSSECHREDEELTENTDVHSMGDSIPSTVPSPSEPVPCHGSANKSASHFLTLGQPLCAALMKAATHDSSPLPVGKVLSDEPLKVMKSIKKDRVVLVAKCTEPRPGQTRYWTEEEHERFLEAVSRHGEKAYVAISNYVETRTPKQVRTHAQKFQMKMARLARSGAVFPGDAPPPHTRGSSKTSRAKSSSSKVGVCVGRAAAGGLASGGGASAAAARNGIAVPSPAARSAQPLLPETLTSAAGTPSCGGVGRAVSTASTLCGRPVATVPQSASEAGLQFALHGARDPTVHVMDTTCDLVSILETDVDDDTDPGLINGAENDGSGSLTDPYLSYIGGEGESDCSEVNKVFAQDLEDLEDVPALATSPFSNPSEEWLLSDIAAV